MINDEIVIRETTQAVISGHYVGVGNIWERETPDDNGVIARRMTAIIFITEFGSKEMRDEIAFVGRVIRLGDDRYCVAKVEEGTSTLGSITLRKLAH